MEAKGVILGEFEALKDGNGPLIDRMIKMPARGRRLLFICAYALYVFGSTFDTTTFDGIGVVDKSLICNSAQTAALLLFMIKLLTQTYERRHIVWIAFGGLLSVISAIVTREFTVAWAVLLVIAAQGITMEDAARVVCYSTSLVIICALFGWATGLNGDVIAARDNGLRRYALGFGHTNRLATCIAISCVSWVVSHVRELRKRDIIVVAIASVAVYILTNSRTTVASLLVFMSVVVYEQYTKRRISPVMCSALMVTAISISLLLAFGYDLLPVNLQCAVNSALTYRPYYFASYLREAGVTLFGSNLAMVDIQYVPGVEAGVVIDNSYVALLLGKGAAVFALLMGLYLLCFKAACYSAAYAPFCLAMMYFSVCGFAENTLASIATNFCTMGIAYLLYGAPGGAPQGFRPGGGRHE